MKTAYDLSAIILSAAACYAAYAILLKKKGNNAMDNNNQPRGYRNNNPLNIRLNPANAWAGRKTPNTDGEFEQFTSMEYGWRAAFMLLARYADVYGIRTVDGIIHRWAPLSENQTGRYVAFVCSKTGFTPTTAVDPSDGRQMRALAYAMAWMENGTPPASDAALMRGWEMYAMNR